jgi:hypothetical protein
MWSTMVIILVRIFLQFSASKYYLDVPISGGKKSLQGVDVDYTSPLTVKRAPRGSQFLWEIMSQICDTRALNQKAP